MADKEITQPIQTDSGIEVKQVYTSCKPMDELPAKFPFTRGVQADMYRSKLWTMRQYAGFSTAEESNKRYHYLLKQGTTGLSVAFDLPTQIGYDSDHELSEGEVGKSGVAIDSLRDMEVLFDGIQLQNITTSMTINSTAAVLLSMYIALAKKQGADLSKISGTIQNDILKEYAARGTYIYPPKPSMRIITDIFDFCSREVPKWNTISVSGYHIREAGSTAVQELAFTLADGKAYLKAAIDAGLDINVFAKRISFFFNAHNNFFEEIAKFRAARRMWASITKELGATDPKAMMLRFHTQTGGSTLTAQQPQNNIMRVTMQALSAVLGGTQSLHTNGFDEALSLPTENAARIAWDYIRKIDDMGGAVAAIEAGYIQNEIAESSYNYQNAIQTGEKVIVGVNKFQVEEPVFDDIFSVDDTIRKVQVQKLAQLRTERNNEKVNQALSNLESAAKDNANLMPYIIQCVEHYTTLGEISDKLRKVFGEYR